MRKNAGIEICRGVFIEIIKEKFNNRKLNHDMDL